LVQRCPRQQPHILEEEVELVEKTDLVEVLLQLMGPHQQQALSFYEVAGLVGLVDLLGILNLLNGNIAIPVQGSNPIQEALTAVLGQGEKGNIKSPADLMALLGKNPALVASLMNLLMSSKADKTVMEKKPEIPPSEEGPAQQQARSSRFRSS